MVVNYAIESFDSQALLDPFEEQFHLSSGFVEHRNGCLGNRESSRWILIAIGSDGWIRKFLCNRLYRYVNLTKGLTLFKEKNEVLN